MFSVVVATFSRPQQLGRCLGSLRDQRAPPEEVIIIDDGSLGETTARVLRPWQEQQLPFELRVQWLSRNGGPARARNVGIKMARAPWIAFTDDDCEPRPDWLSVLSYAAVNAPEDVAGIGGRVVAASNGLVSEFMSLHRILEPPASCSYLVTANCTYRRDVLVAVGGFDERVRHPGGEDPGLSFAVRDAGYGLMFCPAAIVGHHYRESTLDFLKTFYRYGRGVRLVMGR